MKRFPVALFVLSLWSCAAFEIQGEFTRGRQALIRGDSGAALGYFQRVADADPKFVSAEFPLRASIWTYVGRAYYQTQAYPKAKEALEQALAQSSADHIGRLYLGLALARLPVPAPKTTALSAQDIAFALREGVEPERVAALVRERGVAFDVSRDAESQLRRAGADGRLLDEIRKVRAETARNNENPTTRAVKELATALSGLRDDLDSFIATAPQGRFWDPSGEIRAEVRNGLKLVAVREPDWNKIISTGEWLGQRLEEEIDRARRDEANTLRRQPNR
jgi:tetratricopeptide (TPR) repeat protein